MLWRSPSVARRRATTAQSAVHSAYNPTDGETVIVATFLEMTPDGPLSITEGITGPADNCGLAAPFANH